MWEGIMHPGWRDDCALCCFWFLVSVIHEGGPHLTPMGHGDDQVGVSGDIFDKAVDAKLDIADGLIFSREELEEGHSCDVVIDVCTL